MSRKSKYDSMLSLGICYVRLEVVTTKQGLKFKSSKPGRTDLQ